MADDCSEEGRHSYHPGGFHPVYLGDVFHGRYEILRKLGYGRYSTVWLVKDNRTDCYKALKVLSAECYGGSEDLFELEILQRLRESDPGHAGYPYVPTLVDFFEHVGPNGHHVCLVLEPMGESLASFGTLFEKCQVPSPIMQRFSKQLLLALNYAHKPGVIHTDIQPRNIMVQIPDFSIIDDYLKETPANPSAYDPNSDPGAIVSQPLTDFYIQESTDLMTLDIALCDWGSASWTDNHLTEVIQPLLLRAPEVIIGAPWGPPVDIWNLGAALIEILGAMVALFGPFPAWLLTKGDQHLVAEHMDENGRIRDPTPRPEAHLENWIESLTGDDKARFVALLRDMMVTEPGDRKTAEQLLDEPWLQHAR